MSGAGHITITISDISQRKYALPKEGSILKVIYSHIIHVIQLLSVLNVFFQSGKLYVPLHLIMHCSTAHPVPSLLEGFFRLFLH